ncbi:chalcone isomerase family protein [Halopseudomonas sp.]|uniref:chalcone isomerase family protein n=1 Tax=Halopseudomonas sp. TaxID=2901191 RepID=UPI0035664DA6
MIARLFLLICLAIPASVSANEERIAQADFPERMQVDGQELVLRNASLLEYLFVDVYSAALLTPPNQPLNTPITARNPLHLELYYYRDIDREDVIKAAWVALERQYDEPTLTRLRPGIERLHATFTDISAGDRYALTLDTEHALSLKYNGKESFSSRDSELARAYVGIWLRENGLSDSLREELTAGN